MLTLLCIFFYITIIGIILGEKGDNVIPSVETHIRKLLTYGLQVQIKQVGFNYHFQITKEFPGLQVKHLEMICDNLLEGLTLLVGEIERDLSQWIDKIVY